MILSCQLEVQTMWKVPSGPRQIDGSRMSLSFPTSGTSSGLSSLSAVHFSPSYEYARCSPADSPDLPPNSLSLKYEKRYASSACATAAMQVAIAMNSGRISMITTSLVQTGLCLVFHASGA